MIRSLWTAAFFFLSACGGALDPGGDAGTDPQQDPVDDGTEADVPVDYPSDRQDLPVDLPPDVPPDLPPDVPVDPPVDLPEGTICVPSELRCSYDNLSVEQCNSTGTAWSFTPCELGCAALPAPHCGVLDVSNIPDDDLLYAGLAIPPPLPVGYFWMDFDTDTGEVNLWQAEGETWSFVEQIRPEGPGLDPDSGINFEVVAQPPDYPELAVFSFSEIFVPNNMMVGPTGTRPLVLLSAGPAFIEGGVYVGCLPGGEGNYQAGARGPGEGPGAGGSGSSQEVSPDAVRDGGGGGGAFGGSGGEGGGYTAALRGSAGLPYGAPELIPLEGGSGGGWGGGTGGGRQGGISGGAVQIAAAHVIHVAPGGWVDASGCGGRAAFSYTRNEAGGGGGSGGAILLEAPEVIIEGFLSANGGGGAAGGNYQAETMNGEDGHYNSEDPALGGTAMADHSCDGGIGSGAGIAEGVFADPCNASPELYNAGGGGGGAGKIRVNGMSILFGGTLSPPLGSEAATEGPLNLI